MPSLLVEIQPRDNLSKTRSIVDGSFLLCGVWRFMAVVIDTVERDGKTIRVYDNGMEYDMSSKKIVKPPAGAIITKEKSQELHKRRQEKTARLLREAIVAETMDKLEMPHHGTAAAVAAA